MYSANLFSALGPILATLVVLPNSLTLSHPRKVLSMLLLPFVRPMRLLRKSTGIFGYRLFGSLVGPESCTLLRHIDLLLRNPTLMFISTCTIFMILRILIFTLPGGSYYLLLMVVGMIMSILVKFPICLKGWKHARAMRSPRLRRLSPLLLLAPPSPLTWERRCLMFLSNLLAPRQAVLAVNDTLVTMASSLFALDSRKTWI